MAPVTVCVPAYRAERFIHHTLRSVASQTSEDLTVEIAIDPPPADTEAACGPFLEDPRFNVSINERRLGWAGNIAALLDRVRTPFFVILPHDDLWHPCYIETLLEAIASRSDASVAYADMYCFGHGHFRKSLAIETGGSFNRLLSFFLGGAEAVPWRGITRSTVLAGGTTFPSNEFISFAVECEWACHLLRKGTAIRVPRPLYLKRLRVSNRLSVSAQWYFPEARAKEALEHHRRRMLSSVAAAGFEGSHESALVAACEAAMLRRYLDFSAGRFAFAARQQARAREVLADLSGLAGPYQKRLESRVLLPLSRNAELSGDETMAVSYAKQAVEADMDHWEALVHCGRLLLSAGRPAEALDWVSRAATIAPTGPGLEELTRQCDAEFERAYAAEGASGSDREQ